MKCENLQNFKVLKAEFFGANTNNLFEININIAVDINIKVFTDRRKLSYHFASPIIRTPADCKCAQESFNFFAVKWSNRNVKYLKVHALETYN